MRKFSSFMAAAVAMLAAVSCNKEITNVEPIAPETDAVVYTAYVDGAVTKTILGETTGEGVGKTTAALWVENDEITIHNGDRGYTFVTTEDGSSAKFSYEGDDFKATKVMAVYPAGEYNADVENKTVTAEIPKAQQAQTGTYHSPAAVAFAYSEDNTLNFRNATALLAFTIDIDNVTHVYFEGKDQEPIVGNVSLSLDQEDAVSVAYNDQAEVSEVELYAYHDENNKYFVKGETYYIAVGPQTFANGVSFKIRIDSGDRIVVKNTANKVTTKANVILDLGNITAPEWAIAGTFNGWNMFANPMTKEGDYYVLRGVTKLNFTQDGENEGVSSTGIKFVNNGTWRGGEGQVTAGTWAYVWGDGGNIYVEGATADAKYDIYLNPNEGDYGKFVIVPAGDGLPEVTTLKWGLVGNFNSWGKTADFEMVESEGKYVARNFELTSAGNIKIRANEEWNDEYNYGLSSPGTITSGNYYDLIVGSGSQNMTLNVGSYDIWFDLNTKTVTIVAPGVDPLTATKGTPVAPLVDSWYLVGDFNNWTPAAAAFKMTAEGSWYVYKNFNIASGAVKFVADANWSANRGGTWNEVGGKITLSQEGSNISVAPGTYDVYLSSDASYAYFMTTGEVPSN